MPLLRFDGNSGVMLLSALSLSIWTLALWVVSSNLRWCALDFYHSTHHLRVPDDIFDYHMTMTTKKATLRCCKLRCKKYSRGFTTKNISGYIQRFDGAVTRPFGASTTVEQSTAAHCWQ